MNHNDYQIDSVIHRTLMITLNQIAAGCSANVSFLPDMHANLKHRCQTLGIVPGSLVKVLRRAPGKGPLQIKVLNTLYSIRPKDAESIQVTPL